MLYSGCLIRQTSSPDANGNIYTEQAVEKACADLLANGVDAWVDHDKDGMAMLMVRDYKVNYLKVAHGSPQH